MYQDEDALPATEREGSGIYRAFSGSVEAAGASESEALDSLDRNLLRLSAAPGAPDEEEAAEQIQGTLNDTERCPPSFQSVPPPASCAPDTVRAPGQ